MSLAVDVFTQINGFPGLTVEHFYVKLAVVFEISCRKTDRQMHS